MLKPGKNLIAIRVFKTKPDGGFLGKPDELHLALGDQNIPLAGEWKAKLSVDARPPHAMPIGFENWPVMPTVLYKGMLEPIAPLSIAGAIWYQGEQNSPRGYQYRKLLPVTIADWRRTFGQGDFPFYIVSLPAFGARSATPIDDAWAETRESQAIAAATVPNSCLAVTIDTGDPNSLHPKEKEPVGDRLARCALANYYHQHVVDSGPTLKSVQRKPGSIVLHFAHTDGGLVVKGDKLGEFSIAGDDRKWYWADARIKGSTVHRLVAFGTASRAGALCMAVQSRGHAVQRRRPAGSAIQDGRLARHDAKRTAILSAMAANRRWLRPPFLAIVSTTHNHHKPEGALDTSVNPRVGCVTLTLK